MIHIHIAITLYFEDIAFDKIIKIMKIQAAISVSMCRTHQIALQRCISKHLNDTIIHLIGQNKLFQIVCLSLSNLFIILIKNTTY